jgi:hypothetical protein
MVQPSRERGVQLPVKELRGWTGQSEPPDHPDAYWQR